MYQALEIQQSTLLLKRDRIKDKCTHIIIHSEQPPYSSCNNHLLLQWHPHFCDVGLPIYTTSSDSELLNHHPEHRGLECGSWSCTDCAQILITLLTKCLALIFCASVPLCVKRDNDSADLTWLFRRLRELIKVKFIKQ